jgi:hypothetical protein
MGYFILGQDGTLLEIPWWLALESWQIHPEEKGYNRRNRAIKRPFGPLGYSM